MRISKHTVLPVAALAVAALAPAASAASPTTTVRVAVSGCPAGCAVTFADGVTGRTYGTTRVSGGRAVRTLPTSATRGLLLLVSDRAGHQAGEGASAVSFRYGTSRAHRAVDSRTAASATLAHPCFAGTAARDITIRVRAQLYTSTEQQRPSTALRVWASPSLPTVGAAVRTDRGAVPVQDAQPCAG